MRKILAIAWNDVKIEFESRATIIFFLVLPLVFTTVIGVALGNMYGGETDTDSRLVLLVADQDGETLSGQLRSALAASEVVRPVETDAANGLKRVQDGAPALLIIPDGFSRQLQGGEPVQLRLMVDPNNSAGISIEQAVQAAQEKVATALTIARDSAAMAEQIQPFNADPEIQAYWETSLRMAQDSLDNPRVRAVTSFGETVNTRIPSGFEQSSPGQLVTWVLTTLLGGSQVFVNERLGGTLRRLVVSPTSKATILLGKITALLGMGLVQMLLLIGFGALALGVDWGRSPAALALVLFGFGLAGTAFGVMLGSLARTRAQASSLSIIFSMLMAALGGAWWPLEITPAGFQQAVQVLPSTWAMRGLTDVVVRGQSVQGVLLEFGVLAAFAALFFAVGVSRFKYE